MNTFPFVPAHTLDASEPNLSWLVEGLWGAQAVGIIGGEPKSCKSFLALQLAVCVVSGCPCLGRFAPQQTGPVLLFAAEDALSVVRERLAGSCAHLHRKLDDLTGLNVITAPAIRLDQPQDCELLANTVAAVKPRLLVLDPFVRLHRVDENASAAIAPLLAFLRELQRSYATSIAVVHHARKGASGLRSGQALRGTSEFHAWYDSGLFLTRRGQKLQLTIEHRAHPPQPELCLSLVTTGDRVALVADDTLAPCAAPPPARSNKQCLAAADH